jgi:hypothetical protein
MPAGPGAWPGLFTPESDRGATPPEEDNGPLPWSGLQTEFVERTPSENASAEPSTKDALKLFVPVPSLFEVHPSIDTVS